MNNPTIARRVTNLASIIAGWYFFLMMCMSLLSRVGLFESLSSSEPMQQHPSPSVRDLIATATAERNMRRNPTELSMKNTPKKPEVNQMILYMAQQTRKEVRERTV